MRPPFNTQPTPYSYNPPNVVPVQLPNKLPPVPAYPTAPELEELDVSN